MFSCIETSLNNINASQWDAINTSAHPFLSHAFLNGLEICGCVCEKTGWQPQHIVVYSDDSKTQLLAALPCYLKNHSYGEYIFDWAWADGYQRAGRDYYPKLSCAIPFTPVTTPTWLIKESKDENAIVELLLDSLKRHAIELNVSSIHALFTTKQTNEYLAKQGFLARSSSQFHWNNRIEKPYDNFNDFLSEMNARKRKNIKRERRHIAEQGVHFQWFTDKDLNPLIAKQIFNFYLNTIHRYGAQQYLNIEFFEHFVRKLPKSTHILLAYRDEEYNYDEKLDEQADKQPKISLPIAGGLYFASNSSLYGRYWGANTDIQNLHFETCYYQAIEYSIKRKFNSFEAGAQGKHKLARGLMPITTHSMHWLADKDFYDAVLNFTETEAEHVKRYNKVLDSHGPFKKNAWNTEI